MNIFKQLLIPVLGLLFIPSTGAQPFEPNWNSIDSRPIPDWFGDAKFGIFIHWGPYSVPAWSPKGTYSEWYQYWLEKKTLFGNGKFTGTEVYDYHQQKYGKYFSYYDFAAQFKAELFDPNEWADLFEKSGAKYVVLTSKHHDGFCLWPNQQANDRGFPWNSSLVGSYRDLAGELSKAVKNTSLKMGFYYSLYEWFHPWYNQENLGRYIDQHMIPQIKDLVTRYSPDIVWADGEWEHTAETWKSKQFLAWLFNESPVKNTVVVNDRWGKGIRQKHGGYFTTEYESGLSLNKPWEECRGMGFSFGYNRAEDIQDYSSAKTLVLMLCDIVSKGGNLLLDIGPRADGQIPVIMQQRLLEIGNWLTVNGEAIYGTKPWKKAVQWSEAREIVHVKKEQAYLGSDYILKETIDPDPGQSVKELFFTYKNQNLYAISPIWKEQWEIRDIDILPGGKIILLETGQELNWYETDEGVLISFPEYDPNIIKSDYAYAIKISKVRGFATTPSISITEREKDPPLVTIQSDNPSAMIFYTVDGSDPSPRSSLYKRSFVIGDSVIVKSRSYVEGKSPSQIVEKKYLRKKVAVKKLSNIKTDSLEPDKDLPIIRDGNRASVKDLATGWTVIEGKDGEFDFDLGEIKKIRKLKISFYHDPSKEIFGPQGVELEVSTNQWDYKGFKDFPQPAIYKMTDQVHGEYTADIYNTVARYVYVRVKNIGKCPEGHPKAGRTANLYIDEITIE